MMQQRELTKIGLQTVIHAGVEHLKGASPHSVKEISRSVQALCRAGEDASSFVRGLIEAKQGDYWETESALLDTARAASALAGYGVVFPGVKKWLLGQQQDDGSWRGEVTDTTYVLIALADMGEENLRGCKWLVSDVVSVKTTGSTALAITALCRQGFDASDFVAEKTSVLKQRQLADGSWRSLAITNMAVQALFTVGEREAGLQGVRWLLGQQRDGGSWRGERSDNTALTLITLEMALEYL